MLKRIINIRNLFGCIAFFSLLAAPGAVESEMYLTAAALIAGTGICAHLALKEDGKTKKNRSCNLAVPGSVNNTEMLFLCLLWHGRKEKSNKNENKICMYFLRRHM